MQAWLVGLLALIAAVSAQAAPDLSVYAAAPGIEAAEMSPGGKHFVLLIRDQGGQRRVMVRAGDGKAEMVLPIGTTKFRGFRWAGDDLLVMLYSGTVGGKTSDLPLQEFMGAAALDLKTQKSFGLFKGSVKFVDAVFGWFGTAQIDGHPYAFVGAIPYDKIRTNDAGEPTRPDLYRVDLLTGEAKLVDRGTTGEERWTVLPDGSVASRAAYDLGGQTFRLYQGLSTGDPTMSRVAPAGEYRLWSQGRTRDATVLMVRAPDSLSGREWRPGGPPEGELLQATGLGATPLTNAATGLLDGWLETRTGEITLYDPGRQRRVDAARRAFPNLRAQFVSSDSAFDHMIFRTTGDSDSGTFWLVDIAKRSAVPIGVARPEIKPADVGPTRLFTYKSADGQSRAATLTLPPGREAKAFPLIVLANEWSWSSQDFGAFDWWAQALASRGYAVVQPVLRAPDGSVDYLAKVTGDLREAATALAAEGVVDNKRVCVAGIDFGGYAALSGAAEGRGAYRCAVSVAGLSNFAQFLTAIDQSRGSDGRRLRFWKEVTGKAAGGSLDEVSPAHQAARVDAPVLLIHAKDDASIPVQQSYIMARALKSKGKPVETLILDKGDHEMTSPSQRDAVLKSAVAFIEKNNPPN